MLPWWRPRAFARAAEIVAPIMLSLVLTIAVLPLFYWARESRLAELAGDVARAGRGVRHRPGPRARHGALHRQADRAAAAVRRRAPSELTGDAKSFLTSHGIDEKSASTTTEQLDPSKLVGWLTDVLSRILDLLGNLFLLVTLLFFFCSAIPLLGPRFATLRRAKPEHRAPR